MVVITHPEPSLVVNAIKIQWKQAGRECDLLFKLSSKQLAIVKAPECSKV